MELYLTACHEKSQKIVLPKSAKPFPQLALRNLLSRYETQLSHLYMQISDIQAEIDEDWHKELSHDITELEDKKLRLKRMIDLNMAVRNDKVKPNKALVKDREIAARLYTIFVNEYPNG